MLLCLTDTSLYIYIGIETLKNDTACYRASELPERNAVSITQQTI